MSDAHTHERDVESTIARELEAAKDRLAPEVHAALAAAAHAGNLGRARDALKRFRAERPDEAAAAAKALRAHAPFVSAAVADALEPEPTAPLAWTRLWPVPAIAIAVVLAMRFWGGRAPSASPAPPTPTYVRPPAADPTRAFQRFEDSLYPDASGADRELRQHVESTAEAIERALPGRDEIATVALEVESYARRGDCASLLPRAKILGARALDAADAAAHAPTDAAARDAGADARPLVAAFDAAVAALCAR